MQIMNAIFSITRHQPWGICTNIGGGKDDLSDYKWIFWGLWCWLRWCCFELFHEWRQKENHIIIIFHYVPTWIFSIIWIWMFFLGQGSSRCLSRGRQIPSFSFDWIKIVPFLACFNADKNKNGPCRSVVPNLLQSHLEKKYWQKVMSKKSTFAGSRWNSRTSVYASS